jgi:site-specific recombinase XerD
VTKRNLIADISVLYNYARREDLTDTNLTTKVPRPTFPSTNPSVLSPTDFESLLKRCLTSGRESTTVGHGLVRRRSRSLVSARRIGLGYEVA